MTQDELFDNNKLEKEQVLHQLASNNSNYFMDLSGMHTELKVYADEDKQEYILMKKMQQDSSTQKKIKRILLGSPIMIVRQSNDL